MWSSVGNDGTRQKLEHETRLILDEGRQERMDMKQSVLSLCIYSRVYVDRCVKLFIHVNFEIFVAHGLCDDTNQFA